MGREIQVVGGGFSGLAAAYFLRREGFTVRLVEESDCHGGMLQTIHTPLGIVETAANAVLCNALVEETAFALGIPLVSTLPSAHKRFIFRNGQPRRWPLSGTGTLRFLGETLPRFFLSRASFRPRPGESILQWGLRNLGRDATEYLLVPGLTGVYAGRAEELSATLILGKFFGGSRKAPRGNRRGSVAPRNGMGEWGKGFRAWLEKNQAEFSSSPLENIRTVVALPPHRAAEFLRAPGRAPVLAAELEKIEMLPIVSVTCFFRSAPPSLDGFGCLFPRSENFRVLGILANDQIFPHRASPGAHSETWIFGGATDPEILNLPEAELLNLIHIERQRILGKTTELLKAHISRWPKAIPHYTLSLEQARIVPEGNYIPFGTYLGELGLGRVLMRAQDLARSLA